MRKKKHNKVILKLIKEYKYSFINLFICVMVTSFISMFYPFLFGILVDEVFYNTNRTFLKTIFVLYGVLYVGEMILHFNLNMTWSYLKTKFSFDIKKKIFENSLNMPSEKLDKIDTGEYITLINKDADEFINLIHWNIFYLISDILRLFLAITFIFIINVKVGILISLILPVSLLTIVIISKYYHKSQLLLRNDYGKYISWLFDFLHNLKEIKLLNNEKYLVKYTANKVGKIIRRKNQNELLNFLGERSNALISFFADISLYIVGVLLIFNKEMTIGSFIAISEYFIIANNRLKEFSGFLSEINRSRVSIKKVMDNLDNLNLEHYSKKVKYTDGDIIFKDVSFSYNPEGQNIIDNFSLHIKRGEKIAIVGKSGEGKSTLTHLLINMYSPVNGEITINNIDIKEINLKSLRDNIGLVQQDTAIYTGSINENLTFGRGKYSATEIMESCKYSGISEYIKSLPDKLDTIIDGKKNGLSGGQLQRLGIARVLLKNPHILVFDESTSALDYNTEREILNYWYSQHKTTIIIAHRLSTIIKCDKIAVIDKGKVIAYDNHANLIKYCSLYKELFKTHLLGEV